DNYLEVVSNDFKERQIPKPLRAIYLTGYTAGNLNRRQALVKLVEETELNALVIDIKDDSGYLSFLPETKELQAYNTGLTKIKDLDIFLSELKEKNIFVIGRISVFQDPLLAIRRPDLAIKDYQGNIWRDHKNLAWLDPSKKEVWHYVSLIAEESFRRGFDEINFDYIRFPSDGNIKTILYSPEILLRRQADVLEDFFAFIKKESQRVGYITSADLFGLTTVNTDDLGIGQILEKAVSYFDYIAPMVYPSHYPVGFRGLSNPNHHVYQVVRYSMAEAISRLELMGEDSQKLRPWLQDFNYPITYVPQMVIDQKKAVYDSGLDSFMLWNPRNIYTRSALEIN
ncbi:MAG TPA: hypothetical protein ENN31_01295, partial [Candidatus Vogelbacteria bacterium]|nr:hypothetical protein [Candidatus Vogelbacteria bacterium]